MTYNPSDVDQDGQIFVDNLESYIQSTKIEYSSQKENCSSCYTGIKHLLTSLEKEYPDIDINSFSNFFQILEELFSIFITVEDWLVNWSQWFTMYNSINNKWITKESKFMEWSEKYDNWRQDLEYKEALLSKIEEENKILTNDYINLYNTNNENSKRLYTEDWNSSKDEENRNSLCSTIQALNKENKELNVKICELKSRIKYMENETTTKYILKRDHDKHIKALKQENKNYIEWITQHETCIDKLRTENLEWFQVKEEWVKEWQNLQNIIKNNHWDQDENDNDINSNNSKSLYTLGNCNQDAKSVDIENISNNQNNLALNNIILSERSSRRPSDNGWIKWNITSNEIVQRMMHNDFSKLNHAATNTNTCANTIKNNNTSLTSRIKTRYSLITKPYDKLYSTMRIPDDYYKQFFHWTYQALKMNSEDCFDAFWFINPDNLYKKCSSEKVPYHRYHKWLKREILKTINSENKKKVEAIDDDVLDFGVISNFLSTRLI